VNHILIFIDQVAVILPLLTRFGITSLNLGYFVLNNALNNDTTLTEPAKTLGFDPKLKRLRYASYIFNLIAKRYLYRQDVSKFEE
jgi:hypothetical protein